MKASTRLARIPRSNPAAEPKASNSKSRQSLTRSALRVKPSCGRALRAQPKAEVFARAKAHAFPEPLSFPEARPRLRDCPRQRIPISWRLRRSSTSSCDSGRRIPNPGHRPFSAVQTAAALAFRCRKDENLQKQVKGVFRVCGDNVAVWKALVSERSWGRNTCPRTPGRKSRKTVSPFRDLTGEAALRLLLRPAVESCPQRTRELKILVSALSFHPGLYNLPTTAAPIQGFVCRVYGYFPSDNVGEPFLFASLLTGLARLAFPCWEV